MQNSQNMRELSSLFTEVLEVPLAMLEAELRLYRGYKTSAPKLGFEMLGYYIASLEEYRTRLVFLRDDVVRRVEKDAEDTVAAALELKKIHHEQPTLTEKEKKELTDPILKNIPRTGEAEELVVGSVRRVYSVAILQVESLIATAKKLKESYPPIV